MSIAVTGMNNITVGNAVDSHIYINQILNRSQNYADLLSQLKEKQEALENSLPSALEYREKINREINTLNERIGLFKEEINNLYKMFNAVPLNKERLKEAKRLFDEGKIDEARIKLNDRELDSEVETLLKRRDQTHAEISQINQNLKDLSEEYLLKASLSSINFNEPAYINQTILLYENAIKTFKSYEAYSQAAFFYHKVKDYRRAIKHFKNARNYNEDGDVLDAFISYSIGTIYLDVDRVKARVFFKKTKAALERAIKIFNPKNDGLVTGLTLLANSLHNLATTYTGEEKIKLMHEAIEIRKNAATIDSKAYSLLSYTLQKRALAEVVENPTSKNLRDFNTNFEAAMIAMEAFFKADLNTECFFFHANCLPDLIVTARIYHSYCSEEKFLLLKDRFQPMLEPYELYVNAYQKSTDDVLQIARTYDEFNKNYPSWSEGSYGIFAAKKALHYYAIAMKDRQLLDDKLYFGLAFNTQMLSAMATLRGERHEADLLRKESFGYYKNMKTLEGVALEGYKRLEKLENVSCDCPKCRQYKASKNV
ncbi:hypothetical protein BEL04_08690 [Mucilaginibacter sp. PPCGB 2223]|uniref:hypothetical protein n=1 Tax=Mucilaginibacter sp. PPCGB 2223 TaxID=1886027 RepID=UPI00082662F6|nr:hypothetical protein [Mucilaginibacter sp. PPCGB 2223]OCX54326.1 hypothetical protein BEL04_08690 [Mucilaginibacter sp. PPCGB 2223]